jgi:archaellum component FlaD/FlaE
MMDGLFGGDDDADDETTGEAEDGELLGGEEDEELLDDGLGGEGLSDDDLGGEEMAFDDEDGGTAPPSELENRMDELENEVGSLSSTVSTVKSENEQISESVEDIEENIRNLLEVYEMVTRGVNPFVNEDELGDAFGGAGESAGDAGSMGLFGGDEADDGDADLDDDIANADAEDLFDEEVFDEEVFDEQEGLEDGFDGGNEGGDEDADSADDGTSFEELKNEYESGGADWDEGGDADEAATETATDAVAENGDRSADVMEDAPEATTVEDQLSGDAPDAASAPDDGDESRRPHLPALPAGYACDVLVMEWLEFLVDRGGVDGAARSLDYYESIGWLSADAATDLQTFLQGFGETVEAPEDIEPRSPLSVESHRTSLRYVSRLAGSSMGMEVINRLDEPETGGQAAPTRPADPAVDGRPPGARARQPSRERNGSGASAGLRSSGGPPATDTGAQEEPAGPRTDTVACPDPGPDAQPDDHGGD